ncbi:MAG: hypothetical protein K0U60_10390 [Actinomycetia bacterium]|nr:hypothetical protein [Actinomycetes bacterium]MCH9801582.1 hypothetical protein [Actinomycetes bacterium]
MAKMHTLAATAATAAALALPASPALATPDPRSPRGGADVITASGTCPDGTSWTLAGKARGLRILIRLQLQGAPKQRWAAQLTQNDRAIKRVRGKKTKRNGKLRILRPAPNRPGTDLFAFRAQNRTSGAQCQGQLSY